MTQWCFNNNFQQPGINFPSPKPFNDCKLPLEKWCSSKKAANNCGVS